MSEHSIRQILSAAQFCADKGEDQKARRLLMHALRKRPDADPIKKNLLSFLIPADEKLAVFKLVKTVESWTCAELLDLLPELKEKAFVGALSYLVDEWQDVLAKTEEGLLLLIPLCHFLKRQTEQFKYALAHARLHSEDPVIWIRILKNLLNTGDPWWTLELSEEALEVHPENYDLHELKLRSAIRLKHENLPKMLRSFLIVFRSEESLLLAIDGFLVACDFEQAELVLNQGLALYPKSIQFKIQHARFALWKCDLLRSRERAMDVLATQPDQPEARIILGAVSVLEEKWDDAADWLDSVIVEDDKQAEALTWKAELLHKTGDFEAGLTVANQAMLRSTSFNLLSRINRELCIAKINAQLDRTPRLLGNIELYPHVIPLNLDKDEPAMDALTDALKIFGGNRTYFLSKCIDGKLEGYPLKEDPRSIGRKIQHVLYTRGPESALSLSEKLFPSFQHPLYANYRGELLLWLGKYSEAEEIFRFAISLARDTKWSWIGLGASLLYQGAKEEALKTWEEGLSIVRTAGPTLYIYRGECNRLLGNKQEALEDIRTAYEMKPGRISARINLALVQEDIESDGSASELVSVLWESHTAMMYDLVQDPSADPVLSLQAILDGMKGNRSSTMMMYMKKGRLRFV